MRKLLYVSMIHEAADMGSLSGEMDAEGIKKYGKDAWSKHRKVVGEAWGNIEKIVKNAETAGGMRVYQDGLPESDELGMKVVNTVAEMGSRNYGLVKNLVDTGAKLEAAESKELLLEMYNYISRISDGDKMACVEYAEVADDLTDRRDAYVAKRINETLRDGELGVAFFGGRHSIVDKLDEDIEVRVLDEFRDEVSRDLMGGLDDEI